MNEKYEHKQFIPIQHNDNELDQPPTEKKKAIVEKDIEERGGRKRSKK